ncbi:MAG: hypothetical protein RIR97_257 [Pseudomonadota bacterium]
MQATNFDRKEDIVVELKVVPGHVRYLVMTDVTACDGNLLGTHFGVRISVPLSTIATSVSLSTGLDLPLAAQ